jgi:hypothetical protein
MFNVSGEVVPFGGGLARAFFFAPLRDILILS